MPRASVFGWCSAPEIYQKKFPNVKWLHLPDRVEMLDVLRIELEAPSTPLAVVPVLFGDLERLARKGFLRPLTSLLAPFKTFEIEKRFLSLCEVDGELYGIPGSAEPYVIAARKLPRLKRMIDVPGSLGEFEKLLSRDDAPKIEVSGGGFNTRMGFWLSVLSAHGVRLDEPLDRLLEDEDRLIESFQWIKRMIDDCRWLSAGTVIQSFDQQFKESALDRFLAGKAELWAGWANGLKNLPDNLVAKIQLSRFPSKYYGKRAGNAVLPVRGRGWCIPQNTTDGAMAEKALFALMEFEFVKRLELQGKSYFHPQKAVWADTDILKRRPFYRQAEELFEGTLYAFDQLDEKCRVLEWALRTSIAENADAPRFLSRLSGKERSPSGKGAKHPLVRQALSFIEKKLETIKHREDIARHLGVTSDHLNRVFSNEMGESVGAFLMRRRLEEAKKLLSDSTISVKMAAMKLGFKTASYFSRAYKKFWGVSPVNAQRTHGEH